MTADIAAFINSLTPEQKAQFALVLEGGAANIIVETEAPKKKRGRPKKPVAPKIIKESSVTIVNPDFSVVRGESSKKRTPVRGGSNQWVDTGEHKDIETPKFEPTQRSRPEPRYVERTCSVCNKRISVKEDLIYGEFFRCDKCVGR